MLCLGEELLYTTVRLVGQTSNGESVGTGFLYGHENRIFIVTNKHVINGVSSGKFVLFQGEGTGAEWKPKENDICKVSFKEQDFIGHPDPNVDVAVTNATIAFNDLKKQGHSPFWRNISEVNIPSDEDIKKFISPLEEIIFIGYPNGIWDSVNRLPLIRKGITATPYYVDFMGQKKFLIDASVFPGSSGSPVFIYYAGGYPDREGNLYAGNRLFFLGIIAQVYQRVDEGEIKIKDVPTVQTPISVTKQMIDLGIVFKASTIKEAVKCYLTERPY